MSVKQSKGKKAKAPRQIEEELEPVETVDVEAELEVQGVGAEESAEDDELTVLPPAPKVKKQAAPGAVSPNGTYLALKSFRIGEKVVVAGSKITKMKPELARKYLSIGAIRAAA